MPANISTTDALIPSRALSVTGGKGGVGKSTIALNLAVAYAQAGSRTLVVDTDLGIADLNLLLGVAPHKTLLDALGGTPLDEVLVAAHGLHLLPALNGSSRLATIGPASQSRVLALIASLEQRFDTLIVDVAAGIGQAQTAFAGATAEALVVVNPEPRSVAAAYACLKVLVHEQQLGRAYVVANRVTSEAEADELVTQLRALVARFLDLQITTLPPIPADPCVAEAAEIGVPLLVHAPTSPAARAIKHLVRSIRAVAPRSPVAPWLRLAQGVSR